METWPFLVSRNPYLDYRTIVAPDFICQKGIPNLLARVAEGDLTEQGSAICRTVYGSKADDFTIIFRVVRATKKEIGLPGGDEVLKDQFGREIYLIEGIVLRDVGEVAIPQKVLDKAHLQLTKDYRQFWDSIEPPLVKRSSSFSWSVEQTDTLLRVNKLEAYEVTNKMLKKRGNFGIKLVLSILNLITPRICTRLLAVTLIFLLGLLTGILLPSPTPKPTITTIEKRDINILKDKDIVAQLEKLKETNRNSAIFLSGYLKIQTPKTLPELPENSCVERGSDGTSFNIDLYPIDEAINLFKDLEEEKVKFKSDKDKIKMAVVQSTPKLNVMKCLPAAEIPTNQ